MFLVAPSDTLKYVCTCVHVYMCTGVVCVFRQHRVLFCLFQGPADRAESYAGVHWCESCGLRFDRRKEKETEGERESNFMVLLTHPDLCVRALEERLCYVRQRHSGGVCVVKCLRTQALGPDELGLRSWLASAAVLVCFRCLMSRFCSFWSDIPCEGFGGWRGGGAGAGQRGRRHTNMSEVKQ